jgi:hypothetical protein
VTLRITLLVLLLALILPPAANASQSPNQDVALHLEDVGPGFEVSRDPEVVQLVGGSGPFWLLDVTFSRDFQIARELGGPIFVGNRVVFAGQEIPAEELGTFVEALTVNLRVLEWEPTVATGPQLGDASVWLVAQREVDGVPIITYTVAFRTRNALAMVQTVGAADATTMADAEALGRIVAGRLAGVPIPPRPTGRFVSTEQRFSIEFPSEWERLEGQIGVAVSAIAPSSPDIARFRPNCNVVTEPIPAGITLDQYTEAALGTLGQATLDFQSEQRNTGQLGGQPASVLISSFTLPQLEGLRVRVIQFAAIPNDKAYVVTCTAAEDQFATYRPLFETVVASFRFE